MHVQTFGSEIAMQLVPNSGLANVGYVGTTAAGSDSVWLNYLHGDAKTHTAPKHPRNVRFTVCPPSRYAARERLADAEENWASDPTLYTEAQMEEIRFDAQRDKQDFERFKGTVVNFGQQVRAPPPSHCITKNGPARYFLSN